MLSKPSAWASRPAAGTRWPVAPRPFEDEPLGGWFARVAARYKMPVEQLWVDSGMDRPAASLGPVWLTWADVGEANLDRLSWLARVEIKLLSSITPPTDWARPAYRLPYCYTCLIYNRADATAPRWKSAWLAPDASPCEEHGVWLSVNSSCAMSTWNFEHLLTAIRRRTRPRHWYQTPYWRN